MVTNLGNALPHTSSSGFITPKLATDVVYRQPHPEPKPKPKGLDWDRLGPTCPGCQTPSRHIDHTGVCPDCRKDLPPEPERPTRTTTSKDSAYQTLPDEEIERRFTAPDDTRLGQVLTELETTDPAIATAAASYDATVDRITHPEDHLQAPRPIPSIRAKVRAVGPTDVAITLRSTNGRPLDQVKIAALLHDLLTALHQTPAPAAPPPAAAGAGPTPPRPRKTRTSNFPIDQAKQLLESGHTVPQIAAELGCAVSTARRGLTRAGVTIPDGRATHSGGRNAKTTHDDDPQLRDEIIRRYKAGESTVQLARAHDRSAKQINSILRRAGVELRPQANVGRPISDADRTDIATSYADGESLPAIAKRLGVKKDRVRQVVIDAGLEIRPRGGGDSTTPAGTPAAVIRAWAHANGLLDPMTRTGRVPRAVVDAYLTAHPTTEGATPA